jgi:hypothetical protein
MGKGIEIDCQFLKLYNSPWDCGRNFYKNNLIFSKKNDFNKKSKLHALERFFIIGGGAASILFDA